MEKTWFGLGLITLQLAACASSKILNRETASEQSNINWNSPQCRAFIDFSTAHRTEQKDAQGKDLSFRTDGLVILKNNQVVYEFYDGDAAYGGNPETGLYLRDTPHSLWSASKSITGTLIGRAIQDKVLLPNGKEFSLETKLHEIIPAKEVFGYEPKPLHVGDDQSDLPIPVSGSAYNGYYYDITIEHLVNMSANFRWDENYESGIQKSSFLPMLYFKSGHQDMLSYALHAPMMSEGPGQRWNYSGGNSMILMGVLKRLYGEEAFNNLPWQLLFNPMDMKDVVFERDGSGHFIGNSYVHMRPLDMAKVGQLYLDKGKYKGLPLLSESWIDHTQVLSPATQNENTPLEYIKEEGVYGARTFWLNQAVQGYGPEFPKSPKDMFFAAGHYGQLIIVLPTQNMVIARTGHDAFYWGQIDAFVSKAVDCAGAIQ